MFSITALDDSHIMLYWEMVEALRDAGSCRDGYRFGTVVERKTPGTSFVDIAHINYPGCYFTDTTLQVHTDYTYRLRAWLNDSYSGYSDEYTVQTLALDAPTSLVAQPISDQSVTLSWQDNCDFEAGYEVQRSDDAGPYVQCALLDADVIGYDDAGLQLGVLYTYRVCAITQHNSSDFSNEASAATFFPAPEELAAEPVSDQSIALSWDYSLVQDKGYILITNATDQYEQFLWNGDSSRFNQGFCIERKAAGEDFMEIARTAPDVLGYTDQQLDYGATYHYRIRAYTDLNYSAYSEEVQSTIYLEQPSAICATAVNDQQLHIQWSCPITFQQGYSLERSIDGAAFTEIASIEPTTLEFTDSDLFCNTDYTYRVRSFCGSSCSEYSQEYTTQTSFPAPSSLITHLVSDTNVWLIWQDNSTCEQGFVIERRDDGSDFVEIGTAACNETSWNDTTMAYGLQYTYRVRAFTNLNYSSYTNESTQLVEIAAPTDLTATANSSMITLNWNDASVIEENYQLERMQAGGNFQIIATLPANATTVSDNSIQPNIMYFYRVRAITQNNQSAYSSVVNAVLIND
jgi:hypothetical protein